MMTNREAFQKVLSILNDMIDAGETGTEELKIICKYGAKGTTPNDSDTASEYEREVWNRVMFTLERRCKTAGIIETGSNIRDYLNLEN